MKKIWVTDSPGFALSLNEFSNVSLNFLFIKKFWALIGRIRSLPEWIITCFFKFPQSEKTLGQQLHGYGFSPEWILKCSLNFDLVKLIYSIDYKGMVSPLNEFSSGSPNFYLVKKLIGILCTAMGFPLIEFSNVSSNYHFVRNPLDIDCICMVSLLYESSGYWLVGYNIAFIWKHILYWVHNSIKIYDKQISLPILLHLQQNW